MPEHGPDQAGLVPGWHPAVHPRLEVPVQVLVRVELRRVGRQVEELYLVAVGAEPGPDNLRVVHFEVVQDQEDLPARVLDEPREEPDEARASRAWRKSMKRTFPWFVRVEIMLMLWWCAGTRRTGVWPAGA